MQGHKKVGVSELHCRHRKLIAPFQNRTIFHCDLSNGFHVIRLIFILGI